MKRILIIGCPGSGKSTLAKALHQATGFPLYHLDNLFWNADKTTVEKSVFLARLHHILQEETWIIDGNYASTMALRLAYCDTVLFLDYPRAVCLQGIAHRRGKARSDLPWVETEDDQAFLQFVREFRQKSRPEILKLLSAAPDKQVYTFFDRSEAEAFLAGVGKQER